LGDKRGAFTRENTRKAAGLSLICCWPTDDAPSGESFLAAYRPAGTREALPGTMRGTCVLRFDRKGTACRAPTKKIIARAKCRRA